MLSWWIILLLSVGVVVGLLSVGVSVLMPADIDLSSSNNRTIHLMALSFPLNPIGINENPYIIPPKNLKREGYCGIKLPTNSLEYRMETFETEVEAESEGYKVSHETQCGTCSTLRDLGVYMYHTDLTTPVRKCSIMSLAKPLYYECMRRLGFTYNCTSSWFYNSRNTAKACFGVCIWSWITNEPFVIDGHLNDCLQCDETKSGPVFKASAGRTRRDSGIFSAIDRHPEEMFHCNQTNYFDHYYI